MELIVYNEQRQALATRSLDQFTVALDTASLQTRDELVERSIEIELVENEVTQQLAVDVLRDLGQFLKEAEDVRKELKAPVTKLGKKIESVFDQGISAVEQQQARIKAMLNDYTLRLIRERQAAEAKQREELSRLEAKRRELEQQLAMEGKPENREALTQQHKEVLAAEGTALVQPVPEVKVANTKIAMKWAYDVNLNLVAAHRPDLCKIELRLREVNAALDLGETIPGITNARKVPDVRV